MLQAKEKIDVLMNEYKTLRDEILMRTNSGFGMIALGGTILIWLVGSYKGWRTIVYFVFLAALYTAVCVVNWKVIKKCNQRIAQIEESVNQLAGETLLEWEGRWSVVSRDGFGSELWDKGPSPLSVPSRDGEKLDR